MNILYYIYCKSPKVVFEINYGKFSFYFFFFENFKRMIYICKFKLKEKKGKKMLK